MLSYYNMEINTKQQPLQNKKNNDVTNETYNKMKVLESDLHTLIETYRKKEEEYLNILDQNVSDYMNSIIKIVHKNKSEEYLRVNKFGYIRKFNVNYDNIHDSCKSKKFKLIDLTTKDGEDEYSSFTQIADDILDYGSPMYTESCELENRNIVNEDLDIHGIVTKDGLLRKYPKNPATIQQIEHSCPKNEAIPIGKSELYNLTKGPPLSIQHNCSHVKVKKGETELQSLRNEIEKKSLELNDMIDMVSKENKSILTKKEYIQLKDNLKKDLKSVKSLQDEKQSLQDSKDRVIGSNELANLYVKHNWNNLLYWSILILVVIFVCYVLARYVV